MSKRKMTLISGIVCIVLAVIVFLSIITEKKYQVSNLTGQSVQEVKEWMTQNNIPENKVIYAETFSDRVPADHVVSQSIDPSGKITSRKSLVLTISKGENPDKKIALPDFTGKNRDEIEKWLNDNEFSNYQIIDIDTDNADQNSYFCSSEPIAGSNLTKDSEIKISVFKYKTTVVFPDFTGKNSADIQSWADRYGIQVNLTYYYDVSEPETYLYSDLEAGTEIEKGSTVNIAVSAGQ